MATPVDRWQAGDAYERYMGRWSRRLAPRFVQWLGVPPGRRWLDVGCGTGSLSEAILALKAPACLVGVDPSEGFLATARSHLPDIVALFRAPAAALPLAEGAMDVTASSLVLNFVPDAAAALGEMARVTRAGGRVAAAVWDYGGRMDLVRTYWNAVTQLDASARAHDQAERFPLCRPDALHTLFTGAGLRDVAVSALEMPLHFCDFDDYWQPFLGGQGSAPAHAMSLDPATRERLREQIRGGLPTSPDGSIAMSARAWVVRGDVEA